MRITLLFGAMTVFGSAVAAQTIADIDTGWRPLLEVIEQSETTYPLKRCAGLYQSMIDYIGPENMSDKGFDDTDTSLRALIVAASIYDRENGNEGSAADLMKASMSQARGFAERYVGMFEEQQKMTGNPFQNSEFILADFQLCKVLADNVIGQGFGK